MSKKIIEEFEVLIYGTFWHNSLTKESYTFIPTPFDNEAFIDFNQAFLFKDTKEFVLGYKMYIEGGEAVLQILESKYRIKSIDISKNPRSMILIDSTLQEILFEGHLKRIY